MDTNIYKRSITFSYFCRFSKILYSVIACLFLVSVISSCKKDKKDSDTKTGRQATRVIAPASGSTISGTATIEENKDHSFNIKLDLVNTVKDSILYLDIHNGSFVDPFDRQAIDLGTITCTGASASKTFSNYKQATLIDLTRVPMPYDSILTFKGFINISLVQKPHIVSTTLAYVKLNQ